jgi:hypothetical protein
MGGWFEGVGTAAFRPVDNGYVFSAPCFAGPSRRYLVNEGQKMAIAECMRQTYLVVLPAALIWSTLVTTIVVAVAISLKRNGSLLPILWMTAMAIAALIPAIAAAHIYLVHKLRPLLAGLQPTSERGFTSGERFKLQAAHTSWLRLVVMGLGLSAACLAEVTYLIIIVQQNGRAELVIVMSLSVLSFAVGAVYCYVVALRKAGGT